MINDHSYLKNIDVINSIVYFEDLEDLERFNIEDMTATDYSEQAKRIQFEYWTREKLLELKEKHPSMFNAIRSEYVLSHALKRWDLTMEQLRYLDGIRRSSLDISMDELKHVFSLINERRFMFREPSTKFRSFPRYLARYGISLYQTDIVNVLQNLQTEVFCKGCCSTDNESWRRTFLKFEFYNAKFKFSSGRSLSKYGLPMLIYIVIAENLRTNKTVALVSFSSNDFERCKLLRNPVKRVNLNYIEKIGSAYIVSVLAKPYSADDPFLEFYVSESSYNKIIHLIEALTIPIQIKYPLQRRSDAYKTHVLYRSMDPINHGLPIPVDYFNA